MSPQRSKRVSPLEVISIKLIELLFTHSRPGVDVLLEHPFLEQYVETIEEAGTAVEEPSGIQQPDEGGLADLEEVCAGLTENGLPKEFYGVKGIDPARLQALAHQLGIPLAMAKERIDQALAYSITIET